MGVNISDIVPKKTIELQYLNGRTIALDAYNVLYQFLSVIRQPDGTPLMNSQGKITSHLTGLLYRTTKLVEYGIRPVYVFDGQPPDLKSETIKRRVAIRKQAKEKWDDALQREDLEAARTYAQQAVKLTDEMVEQSMELLNALGIPSVQAPSEGEAQASFMTARGDVWGTGSQDFDSLLFGTPTLVRNLTIVGRRKVPKKNVYVVVQPEVLSLPDILKELRISREQLVDLALMVGTDYHDGVKGIGPKKALSLVQKGRTAKDVFGEHGLDTEDVDELRSLFLSPNVTEKYQLKWSQPNEKKAMNMLCDVYEFSEERVRNTLDKMKSHLQVTSTQSRLDKWFGE